MSSHRSRTLAARTPAPRRRARDGDPETTPAPDVRDLLAVARTVTEQTRKLRAHSEGLTAARRAVDEANQQFADLYDFVPIPYLIVSNLGIIQHVNESGLQMLGRERQWVEGRPLISYVDTPDMRKVLDSVLGSSKSHSQSIEVRVRARDGIRVVQMITRRRQHDESPALPTFHIAIVDLTETRRLEEERRHAEDERQRSQEAERTALAASESKDEFLAMLSHELRTPLTPMLAAADAMLSHESLSPELTARLEIIRRNVQAEARLIDDLLDVARITRNKLEVARRPIDLHSLLAETLDGWRVPIGEHGLHLQVAFDAKARWVNGDAGRLGQVLRNVITNAVKFTEAGGRLSVRTEERDGRLRVTISDTGAGMTGPQLAMLFTPFARKRRKDGSPRHGLGLGLVISHAIVEAHEGALHVWSAGPGKGTTVQMELPTIATPAEAVVTAARSGLSSDIDGQGAPGESFPTAKVLLVEDDPDSAEMLALLLSSEGFQVQVAHSLHHARALADGCDLLVSDIALPDGNGLDLMRGIRRQRAMRGIALSGYGSGEDVQRSLEAGFEDHLTKPVDLDQLVAAVRRLATSR